MSRFFDNPNEDITGAASGTPQSAIVLGICVAFALAIYGMICIVTQHSYMPANHGPGLDVYGAAAIAMGFVWTSMGCFMHCHYCWSHREKYHGYAQIGKLACGILFVIALFYAIIQLWFID